MRETWTCLLLALLLALTACSGKPAAETAGKPTEAGEKESPAEVSVVSPPAQTPESDRSEPAGRAEGPEARAESREETAPADNQTGGGAAGEERRKEPEKPGNEGKTPAGPTPHFPKEDRPQPEPEEPAPLAPTPQEPAPEDPAPQDPAPEQPEPEGPVPEEPDPQPFDIEYYVAYAKAYAVSVGLELDPDTMASWDTPMIFTAADAPWIEESIRQRIDFSVREGDTGFWCWAEDLGDGRYKLYIGRG